MSCFTVPIVGSFRLDLTVWVLRRQAHNTMDLWDGEYYRRAWDYQGERLILRLRQPQSMPTSMLEGEILYGPRHAEAIAWLQERLHWILGLDQDLAAFHRIAQGDARLRPLLERYQGMRPPRFNSLFEGLINAIACQQVSLVLAITLLNRLCRLCAGEYSPKESLYPFPCPQQILEQDPLRLREIGFSRQKIRSVFAVAQAAVDGALDERRWQHRPRAEIIDRLQELPGIGRWSAEYALLRALGRLEVFPGDDVGGRNGLFRWLGRDPKGASYEETLAQVAPWSPYAGMVYFLMLLRRLEADGHIPPQEPSAH